MSFQQRDQISIIRVWNIILSSCYRFYWLVIREVMESIFSVCCFTCLMPIIPLVLVYVTDLILLISGRLFGMKTATRFVNLSFLSHHIWGNGSHDKILIFPFSSSTGTDQLHQSVNLTACNPNLLPDTRPSYGCITCDSGTTTPSTAWRTYRGRAPG